MSVERVTLGGIETVDGFGMYLTDVEIDPPEVQTNYIQVPGRNGELDFTEALTGEPRYYNGTLTMTFQSARKLCNMSWDDFWYNIRTLFHGRTTGAIFDSGLTFSGRCEVSGTPTAGGIYEIVITMSYTP